VATSPVYHSDSDPPSKRALLTAALKLFARDGVTGTNIRAIASEAGYTNPSLFKFFDGKEALALYLFERCYTECLSAMRATLDKKRTFEANMRSTVRGLIAFVDSDPEVFFFVYENLRHFWPIASEETRKHSMIGEFRKLLLQGRREGIVSSDVAIEIQIAAVTGFLFQLARLHYFGEIKGDLTSDSDDIENTILKMIA
jgi:AcrR family transcriptional regulator